VTWAEQNHRLFRKRYGPFATLNQGCLTAAHVACTLIRCGRVACVSEVVSLDTRMPGFAYPHDPYRVILCHVIVDTLGQQTDLVCP